VVCTLIVSHFPRKMLLVSVLFLLSSVLSLFTRTYTLTLQCMHVRSLRTRTSWVALSLRRTGRSLVSTMLLATTSSTRSVCVCVCVCVYALCAMASACNIALFQRVLFRVDHSIPTSLSVYKPLLTLHKQKCTRNCFSTCASICVCVRACVCACVCISPRPCLRPYVCVRTKSRPCASRFIYVYASRYLFVSVS
jgi:hypothetical protein